MNHSMLLGLLLFVLTPGVAQNTIVDGNSFESQCSQRRRMDAGVKLDDTEFMKATFCVGYIRGIVDVLVLNELSQTKLVSKDGEWKTPCFPQNVTNEQSIKIVLKYLADNPAKLHYTAYELIVFALRDAFPCH